VSDLRAETRALIAQREAILERVRRILIDNLHVRRAPEEIDPDVSIFGTGLGLDSVDAVELVLCLETELGVKLSDQEVARDAMRTVNALVDLALAVEHQP
jgi:acyl carrier protein